ncbi:MAG: 50S ribosomal protein L9 [Cyanobacteria bacterium J06641_5]
MPKRVTMVLKEDVYKLGDRDSVVNVAPGYARNFLVPRGMAIYATPGALRQVEQRRAKAEERRAKLRKQAEDRKVALETVGRFTVRKQVGEDERIFGSVTAQEVVDVIKESTNQEIDRRGVKLPEIGSTGFYKVEIEIQTDVVATIEIQVAPQ